MVAGIQIINAHGSLQLDETYQNHRVVTQFTGQTNTAMSSQYARVGSDPAVGPTNPYVGSYIAYSISKSQTTNPIFVLSSNYLGIVHNVIENTSTNSWEYTVQLQAAVGASFTMFIFDGTNAQSNSGFGFQVYSSSGGLGFDITNKYLRVERDIYLPPNAGTSQSFFLKQYDWTQTYGAFITLPHFSEVIDTQASGGYTFKRRTRYVIGARTAEDGQIAIGSFPTSVFYRYSVNIDPTTYERGGPIMGVDLTHYF